MGAAHYTIAGIEGEIDDYRTVMTAMKDKMAAMSENERQEVEQASKILRRLRVGAAASGPVALPAPIVRRAGHGS